MGMGFLSTFRLYSGALIFLSLDFLANRNLISALYRRKKYSDKSESERISLIFASFISFLVFTLFRTAISSLSIFASFLPVLLPAPLYAVMIFLYFIKRYIAPVVIVQARVILISPERISIVFSLSFID